MSRYRTAFLDRDGTINRKADEGSYITRPDEVALLPGAADAIRRLNESGRLVVVVSNQRGIARGVMDAADLDAVTGRLIELLAAQGARVDAWYYCPHDRGECDCRKPLPGMLVRAAAELDGVELSDAILVGDAESDVQAAVAAGIPAIRIAAVDAPASAPDLAAAVEQILAAD
jgi:D-glycero-D-manno-heptose 1,7-bisphosphate phosphatase